jgi:hypothetical protein
LLVSLTLPVSPPVSLVGAASGVVVEPPEPGLVPPVPPVLTGVVPPLPVVPPVLPT